MPMPEPMNRVAISQDDHPLLYVVSQAGQIYALDPDGGQQTRKNTVAPGAWISARLLMASSSSDLVENEDPRGPCPVGSLTALRRLCDDLNACAALAEANRRTQQ